MSVKRLDSRAATYLEYAREYFEHQPPADAIQRSSSIGQLTTELARALNRSESSTTSSGSTSTRSDTPAK